MKVGRLTFLVALCLLLTGCSLFDGSYLSVTPHEEQTAAGQTGVVSANNYRQLQKVVEDMVSSGSESGVISIADYDQELVEQNMTAVVRHICQTYPIGAYAVEDIQYEVGTNSGRPAIAVTISYRHSRVEIQRIRRVQTMDGVQTVIGDALDACDAGVVLQVANYQDTDFSQIVEDYAEAHPDTVMESPLVAAGIYGSGDTRVVELTFTYQTSRESLRSMQSQVKTVFDSAALYVSGEGSDSQKLSQLYGFLIERFDYAMETSITPAYSLLRHGVGDSRAFAVVYAAMCRQAGLECQIVTGTRMGEPWTWNIVRDNDLYYHVDLIRSSNAGGFVEYLDGDMTGYVWDYSAYPACATNYAQTMETQPQPTPEDAPEESDSQETTENLE